MSIVKTRIPHHQSRRSCSDRDRDDSRPAPAVGRCDVCFQRGRGWRKRVQQFCSGGDGRDPPGRGPADAARSSSATDSTGSRTRPASLMCACVLATRLACSTSCSPTRSARPYSEAPSQSPGRFQAGCRPAWNILRRLSLIRRDTSDCRSKRCRASADRRVGGAQRRRPAPGLRQVHRRPPADAFMQARLSAGLSDRDCHTAQRALDNSAACHRPATPQKRRQLGGAP